MIHRQLIGLELAPTVIADAIRALAIPPARITQLLRLLFLALHMLRIGRKKRIKSGLGLHEASESGRNSQKQARIRSGGGPEAAQVYAMYSREKCLLLLRIVLNIGRL